MSEDRTAEPLVQLVGDEGAGYCEPETGVCALPDAFEAQDPDGGPRADDDR